MNSPIANFVTCPFCAGHEKISAWAIERFAGMIHNSMSGWDDDDPLKVEMDNIRNTILNMRERTATTVDDLLS